MPGLQGTPTHPYLALSNQVLGQTLPWWRHRATTEWGLPTAEGLGGASSALLRNSGKEMLQAPLTDCFYSPQQGGVLLDV